MDTGMTPIYELPEVQETNATLIQTRETYVAAAERVKQCDRDLRSVDAMVRLSAETRINRAVDECASAELAMQRAQQTFETAVNDARQKRHVYRREEQASFLLPHLLKLEDLVNSSANISASQEAEKDEDSLNTSLDPLWFPAASPARRDEYHEHLRGAGFGDVVDEALRRNKK